MEFCAPVAEKLVQIQSRREPNPPRTHAHTHAHAHAHAHTEAHTHAHTYTHTQRPTSKFHLI